MDGGHRVPHNVTACQEIQDPLAFKQCLCRYLPSLSCDVPESSTTTTTTTTVSPSMRTPYLAEADVDWSRSYSISAGLCILFLAMCAVIIVLRLFRQRDETSTSRGRTTTVTPPVDPNPPPYEIVVQSPPSYTFLEPPAYSELYVNKLAAAHTATEATSSGRGSQDLSSAIHHPSQEAPAVAPASEEEASPSTESSQERISPSCALVVDSEPVVDPRATMHRRDSSSGGGGSRDA